MAYISVTNQFVNGTVANATDVNQNFTDIVNGLKDGTKDLNIAALNVGGTLTATTIDLPDASTTAKGVVKTGYSFAYLYTANSNYSKPSTEFVVASAPVNTGNGVITMSGASEVLKITALYSCIVDVGLNMRNTQLIVYKNTSITVAATQSESYSNTYYNAVYASVDMAPNDYLTFGGGSVINTATVANFNATAILVN